jgi:hypothetical protein
MVSVDAPLDIPVASRAIGTWLLQADNQLITWNSSVSVITRGLEAAQGEGTITWSNRDQRYELTVPFGLWSAELVFESRVEQFADPSPDDADGDTDRDGILDWQEAALAERGTGVGDPTRQDIVLLVGYTHPDWAMTPLTVERLRSVFLQNGITLYVATQANQGMELSDPGLMSLGAAPLPRDHQITATEVRDEMRPEYVRGFLSDVAHLVVLAENVVPPPGSTISFGEGWPCGLDLAVRSHFMPPLIGADVHEYQAKGVMHELGHNLGLDHPADPASSVMGTPDTDQGNPVDWLLAQYERPLDYTQGEWNSLDLSCFR